MQHHIIGAWVRRIRRAALAGLALAAASNASAFVLYDSATCAPGTRWSTTDTVKVKLLWDSYLNFYALQPADAKPDLGAMARMVADVQAVVDEYNAVPGSRLRLEYAGMELGDDDLQDYPADTFAAGAIIVGFTTGTAASNEDAPAWARRFPSGACTPTRAHLNFKANQRWVFGPPADTGVSGKFFDGGTSFRAVLLHEMGHALGLAHETDTYAVMDHGTKAWTRGTAEVPQMELLPDDMMGIATLYGTGSLAGVDVSLTNTTFQTAQQITDANAAADRRNPGCTDEEATLSSFHTQRKRLLQLMRSLQGVELQTMQALLARLETSIAAQDAALWECRYREDEAQQVNHCDVSSRGDDYVDPGAGAGAFCGVNAATGSAYPPVGREVCPGHYVQVRYTANNRGGQAVKIRESLWFSRDDALLVGSSAADPVSPDEREFDLQPGQSARIGRIFRVPTGLPAGNYKVFAHAVPHDPASGASLWWHDGDRLNNSVRLRGTIDVVTSPCG